MLEPRLPFADAFVEETEQSIHDAASALQMLRAEPPEVLAQFRDYLAEIADTASDLLVKCERRH